MAKTSRHSGNAPVRRPSNLRTALVLLSIAVVFFAGIIINRYLFA